MGLNKTTASGGVFLRLLDGSIAQKSKEYRKGWELYKTQNPSTTPPTPIEYYINRYESIDGYLVKITRVEKADKHIFGWKLHLLDDVEMVLDLKDGAPTTRRVLAMLPNIDLDKKVEIKVFKDDDGYNAIMFTQDGKNVPQFWNKETLPEPRKIGGKLNYSEAEAKVYDETIKLAEKINAHGSAPLEAYQDSVREAVEQGTYRPHEAEVQESDEPEYTGEPPLGDFENEVVPDEIEDSVPF